MALEMKRNIHDGVHGLIKLTAEEMRIIDHPLFQRLRWICQTGLLKYICPSATHTRFEHSLGVLHMGQKMLDALCEESQKDSGKVYPLKEAEVGRAVRFDQVDADLYTRIQRLTRLCCLVHDLGHGPLSHAFDVFAPPIKDIAHLLDSPRLSSLAPFRRFLLESKTGRVDHEAVSCIMFATIWSDLQGDAWIVPAICSVLLGKDADDVLDPEIARWIPLIRDLVSSSPIDADRMDYLLRDSRMTNVAYGLYEPNRILKSILCVATSNGSFRLGWRKSGLRAIECFAQARFEMFAQIYYHKTLRAIELMLQALVEAAKGREVALISCENPTSFMDSYVRLSDEMFLRTLCGYVDPDFPKEERVRDIARRILHRRLWRRVYDFEREDMHTARDLKEAMEREFPDRNFIIDRQPLKAMRGLETAAPLLELDEEGKYRFFRVDRTWLEASPTMHALRMREESILRLFVETSGDVATNAASMRKAALRLARNMR